jgi:hypothetical protein
MVEHVMTGRRRYLSDLTEVTEFIRQQVESAQDTSGQ